MQVAEQALQLMRDMTASDDENSFMAAYSSMQVEVSKMREELLQSVGKIKPETYKKKEERVDSLSQCLTLFHQSYFKMMYYKQEMVTWRHKCLEKELEFTNFITEGLENQKQV